MNKDSRLSLDPAHSVTNVNAGSRPSLLDLSGEEIQALDFPYQRSSLQNGVAHHPVVIVGAGPVGLTLAIDLAQGGHHVVLLDNDHKLSTGSRAICFAKRTLEIWHRLGIGLPALNKGVAWETGRVFHQEQELYSFQLLAEAGHQFPAFVNLQQYYAEAYLLERALQLSNIDIRWHNTVTEVVQTPTEAKLTVSTPDGPYQLTCAYLVACDGSRSAVRQSMGLESKGRVFQDRFLIADVVLDAEAAKHFPSERWFWFDPSFHRDQSVLLHRQPDGVWRIDFQLGWDADPEHEKQESRIRPRVDAMMQAALGRTIAFTLQWASVYTFACMRMDQFVHERVIFAGDAAHGVSPFGARGANSGVQDADNLGWKLSAVLNGQANQKLLASYGEEREYAADVNIGHSTRATDFLTPKNAASQAFRNACLHLAKEHDFARKLINTGRLSTATVMPHSSLMTPDVEQWNCPMQLGMPALDAPWKGGWLLEHLGNKGDGFTLLKYQSEHDSQGLVKQRYDATEGACFLFRPDQVLCGRWRVYDESKIAAAQQKALAQ